MVELNLDQLDLHAEETSDSDSLYCSSIDTDISMDEKDFEVYRSVANTLLFTCPFDSCKETVPHPFIHPQIFADHLKTAHFVIIDDFVQVLPFLQQYVNELYALRKEDSTSHSDYHVWGRDKQDLEIKQSLRRKTLERVIAEQERERKEDHPLPRPCLFCKDLQSNKYALFAHMFEVHKFNIGLLDNLVYVDEFLNILECKMASKQCIYCERFFKSGSVLRKHMRKKKHFKIHPKQPLYDKYYLVNYLEPGSKVEEDSPCFHSVASEGEKSDDDWNDWDEDMDEVYTCLFDSHIEKDSERIIEHMKSAHNFDLNEVKDRFDFYCRIKIINYIRHRTMKHECMNCDSTFVDLEQLSSHMNQEKHYGIPPDSVWNQQQYFLPIYEDDAILRLLDVQDD